VALELALAGLPMVVGYRLNPLTEAFLARALRVPHVNLVNLLLDRPLVPELLGRDCAPEKLAEALLRLVRDERVRAAHRQGYDAAMRRLGAGATPPSRRAAERILAIIAARPSARCDTRRENPT
jgi:lipid-A-disaccharide synthase